MPSFSLSLIKILLAVHIGAVLVAFGVILAYPLYVWLGNSIMEPRGLPILHRAQQRIIQRLVNPGLAAVVVSGLALAADLGTLGAFYVEWGIVAALGLGAITGGYLGPRQARLAQMSERDLKAGGGVLSQEYETLSYQVTRVTKVASAIVLATLLVMVAHN